MHGGPNSLTLIGLGSVGLRLAKRWQEAGLQVRAHSRSVDSRSRARAEGLPVEDDFERALLDADSLVLAVADAQLEPLVQRLAVSLAKRKSETSQPVVLHTSGSRSAAVLAPLATLGCSIGTLHPLAAFAPKGPGPDLAGVWCAISGDERALGTAEQLVAALGARTFVLSQTAGAAANYHAAAALLSNGTVALTSITLEVAQRAGRDPEVMRLALIGLLRGTLENLERQSPESALTGPVSRGDVATVRRHFNALADKPEALALYRLLSKRMLAMAVHDGRLDASAASAVERVLED